MASFSPITNKVCHALMKIDVSSDTIEDAKKKYTNGTICVSGCTPAKFEQTTSKNMFEVYNLAYEERFVTLIRNIYHRNSEKAILVQTNISNLDNVTALNILTTLDYRDKLLFLDLLKQGNLDTFVARDVKLLELLTRLATRELLYSTFHFLSDQITICCQPSLSFPLFVTDFDRIETYVELIMQANLNFCNLDIKYD